MNYEFTPKRLREMADAAEKRGEKASAAEYRSLADTKARGAILPELQDKKESKA